MSKLHHTFGQRPDHDRVDIPAETPDMSKLHDTETGLVLPALGEELTVEVSEVAPAGGAASMRAAS